MSKADESLLSILQVERETGITKETLRKWELRYGFPNPMRQENGERGYTSYDLQRLKTIKRLLDGGHRPGKIVVLSSHELSELQAKTVRKHPLGADSQLVGRVLTRLRDGDVQALTNDIESALLAQGLNVFVEQTLPPLISHIGDQWSMGSLEIHQEHLFSEVLRSILQHSALRLRGSKTGTRVLMGTAPDELHGMGLIMLQTLLTLEGAQCINLGTQVPLNEMVNSAKSYHANIVAVSFSLAYTSRRIAPFILQLRQKLPGEMAVWAGGAGVDRLRSKWPGVTRFDQLGSAAMAIRRTFAVDNLP